jgi:hypothetical protein
MTRETTGDDALLVWRVTNFEQVAGTGTFRRKETRQ